MRYRKLVNLEGRMDEVGRRILTVCKREGVGGCEEWKCGVEMEWRWNKGVET